DQRKEGRHTVQEFSISAPLEFPSKRTVPMVTATKTNNRMAKKETAPVKSSGKHDPAAAGEALMDDHPALKTAVQQIEKQYGEGSIMPLGTGMNGPISGIPTGSLSLDMALGGVGVPKGRIIEIFGPESSGQAERR